MACVPTLGFLRAPLSVRSLVRREVSLPGGVLNCLAWPGSPLSPMKLGVNPLPRIMEPGTTAVSLGSVIADLPALISSNNKLLSVRPLKAYMVYSFLVEEGKNRAQASDVAKRHQRDRVCLCA